MRRPVMFFAGLMMATGASLALAGPASAAVTHNSHSQSISYDYYDDDEYGDDEYDVDYEFDYRYTQADSYNNGNSFNGINILSGVVGGGGLL